MQKYSLSFFPTQHIILQFVFFMYIISSKRQRTSTMLNEFHAEYLINVSFPLLICYMLTGY